MRTRKTSRKIYRLVDSRFPRGHEDHIRYIGRTRQELKNRLSDHWSTRSLTGGPKCAWLMELVASERRPEIELVETISPGVDIGEREKYWIECYCELGYRLLNIKGNDKRWPQFLSEEEREEQRRYRKKVVEPVLARITKIGVERLLEERPILEIFYEAESKLIADMLWVMLKENKERIMHTLTEDSLDRELIAKARVALERPLPERSDAPALSDLKRSLRKRAGLSSDASLQDCIDTIVQPESRVPEPVPESVFQRYRRESDEELAEIERRVLGRIERGEIKGVTVEIFREAIGPKKPPVSTAAHLEDYPALKQYVELTKEHGDDWFVFFMGREPTKRRREKVEELKREAREKGWRGLMAVSEDNRSEREKQDDKTELL